MSDVLHRYWDEVALETMQSLGQGNPDARYFTIQPGYRSVFLDKLFAARDFVEPPFRSPPLVRCLYERTRKIYFDSEFRTQEAAFFEHLQNAEAERLGIQAIGWSGKKRDVIPFVDEFCRERAFEKRHRNRWRRKGDGVLCSRLVSTSGAIRTV